MIARKPVAGKALLVIAPKDFRDEEYFETRRALEDKGISVVTASKGVSEARGMLGGKARVDMDISLADADAFDAVVFIGGTGAHAFFNDPAAHRLAASAFEKGRIVAAICIAPVILANAGILQGKKATVWGGVYSTQIEAGGADYTGEDVVTDGSVITANGPDAARDFGRRIAKEMEGKGFKIPAR